MRFAVLPWMIADSSKPLPLWSLLTGQWSVVLPWLIARLKLPGNAGGGNMSLVIEGGKVRTVVVE